MNENYFKAKDARRLTFENVQNTLIKQLDITFEHITDAINKGKFNVCVDVIKLGDAEISKSKLLTALSELGYKANYISCQKDGDYIRIKW